MFVATKKIFEFAIHGVVSPRRGITTSFIIFYLGLLSLLLLLFLFLVLRKHTFQLNVLWCEKIIVEINCCCVVCRFYHRNILHFAKFINVFQHTHVIRWWCRLGLCNLSLKFKKNSFFKLQTLRRCTCVQYDFGFESTFHSTTKKSIKSQVNQFYQRWQSTSAASTLSPCLLPTTIKCVIPSKILTERAKLYDETYQLILCFKPDIFPVSKPISVFCFSFFFSFFQTENRLKSDYKILYSKVNYTWTRQGKTFFDFRIKSIFCALHTHTTCVCVCLGRHWNLN